MTVPKPITQTVEDVATSADRAFFARHPDADSYVRRRIPNEFAALGYGNDTDA